ncbi:MAG: hypothetical protein F6K53_34220 [Moorea sp. SIO4A1]|uniref:hypothetical protein n=1 Tax=Moorena sp. SIO4A1 TaxID=2607835 RepID=UPI00144E12D3|nr:hypothetical protein [Moorena sp. SIO4A1]NEQ62191.1 hypothetical protein [Moorena sp. SIO4A1]
MLLNKVILNKVNGICYKLDISILYQSEVGIKCFNQLLSSDILKYFCVGEIKSLQLESLYLCADGLKDSHTLVNTNIVDSPHFDLMKNLKNNKDVMDSSYVKRVNRGILDFRSPRKVNHNYIAFLKTKYQEKMNSIKIGNYEPIKVFNVDGRYFIADGKHTAACCALIGVEPKVIHLSKVIYDSFWIWVYKKMLKNSNEYKKNIEFFKSALRDYA